MATTNRVSPRNLWTPDITSPDKKYGRKPISTRIEKVVSNTPQTETPALLRQTTDGVTREPTNGFTKEPTNGFTKEPTNGFTKRPTNGFTEELTNGFTREPTNDLTKEPRNDLTKEQTNDLTKEPTKGFTKQPIRNLSRKLPKKSKNESIKGLTKDSKNYATKEWNIKMPTKLALYLFANTYNGIGIYSERNDFIKDLLKFVVNNEFWLFVESSSEDFLNFVHKCLIQSSFEAKDNDPAVFGRSSHDERRQQENDFFKDYFIFDLDGNRYLKNEEQNSLDPFEINQITFRSAIFMIDMKPDIESIVTQFKANIPVVLMKDSNTNSEELWKELGRLKDELTNEQREKLISNFTIVGRYEKEKDDIAAIILSAIRKTIPAMHNHKLDGNLDIQSTSSSYSSGRDQFVPETTRSLSEVKFSTDAQPLTNTKLITDGTAATEKTSTTCNIQALEYFLLCLKVNCLEKAREIADIWQQDLELTSQVINQAVADDNTDFIRLMLEEDLHILEYIDQDIFSKNRHHCKYHLPEIAYIASTNSEMKNTEPTQCKETEIVQENVQWNKCISCINPCKFKTAARIWKFMYSCKCAADATAKKTSFWTRLWTFLICMPKYNCTQETIQAEISSSIDNMCPRDNAPEDKQTLEAQTIKNRTYFTNIANKLFEKSVRARKIKLAKLLWRRVSHPTGAALYACGILKVLRQYETNQDQVQQLKNYFKYFEKCAVDTIMRTYQKYPEETIRLLIFSMPEWGNTTCIYLAINNYNLNFLSQTPCTELNDRLWNWGTHVKNECMWHVKEESEENESTKVQNKEAQGGSFHRSANGNIGEHSGKLEHCRVCDTCKDNETLVKLSFWALFYVFCCCSTRKYDLILRKFLAPSVLVLLQLLGHLVFLVLYAMLLVSVLQAASFHWLEWLVWAWIISFVCEEFNQYLRNPLFKWLQLFLVVKLISFAFFFAGYGLRIAASYNPTDVTMINYTHVILGMSYIGFSVGLLEICYSSAFFGPLMAMFKNMVLKVLRFMVIILVFFFSYAVASESVLYPRSKLTPMLAYYVVRKAFWGMFGEFFLDELESQEGDIDEPTCTNDPTKYEDYGQLRCPTGTGRYFVPILLGFYFLTINILLFSILIAVFNSEIKRIEQKAEGVWRRHSLRATIKYHKMRYPAPIFLLFVPFLCKMSKNKERFAPFLKEITKAEKPLQLRLSRIQEEIREQYIVDMAGPELQTDSATEPQIQTQDKEIDNLPLSADTEPQIKPQVKEHVNLLPSATEPQIQTQVKEQVNLLFTPTEQPTKPQVKDHDNFLLPITISCKVNCSHADSPEYQKNLYYRVGRNRLNENAAVAVLTSARHSSSATTNRRPTHSNRNRKKINPKYKFFAVRSRSKYGTRWQCVKVRPLETKKVRHNNDPVGLYVSVTTDRVNN